MQGWLPPGSCKPLEGRRWAAPRAEGGSFGPPYAQKLQPCIHRTSQCPISAPPTFSRELITMPSSRLMITVPCMGGVQRDHACMMHVGSRELARARHVISKWAVLHIMRWDAARADEQPGVLFRSLLS